jgi:acyl carrier protein
MTADPILDRVRAVVVRLAGPDRIPARIGPDTPLAAGGFHLDSVELLDVMLACETELGVEFDGDPAENAHALTSLGTLAAAIRARTPR